MNCNNKAVMGGNQGSVT